MARVLVGIDVGKQHHQVAAWDAVADRPLGELRIAVSRAGYEQLAGFLAPLAQPPGALLVGVEATGHYHLTVVEFLVVSGFRVVLLSPHHASAFRRSLPRLAKSDRIDAAALARLLAVQAQWPVGAVDQALHALRELTRLREELARERSQKFNRLSAALDLAFPELRVVCGPVRKHATLALLAAYPTAHAVAAADRAALEALLRKASRGRMKAGQVGSIMAAARASVATRVAEPGVATRVGVLTRQLASVDAELAMLEHSIVSQFRALGYREEDFPIGSAVALATLLAEVGDVRRFSSAKRFLSHIGWCPVDVQTGERAHPHPRLSQAGNASVRRIVWLLAMAAVSRPGPYRSYLERRTAAGKNKMHSMVAVGRKLLVTTYAILTTGRPYDPAYQWQAGPPTGQPAPGAAGRFARG